MKIALGQFAPTSDSELNRAAIESIGREAASNGAALLVLPEEAMVAVEGIENSIGDVARRGATLFVESMSVLSRELGMFIVAPGYEPSSTGLPYNTTWAFDSEGALVARYRKMHLYDAFAYQESRIVSRGDVEPTVFDVHGFTVGLINCYDVRFPEHARALVEKGANVLAVSAAWADGEHKEDHWNTLVRARAIENTCWVVAAGSSSPGCIGGSMAVDPMGVVTNSLGAMSRSIGYANVGLERLDQVREQLPVLRNRRIFVGSGARRGD